MARFKYADHAPGNRQLQAELRAIFKTRTSAGWIAFSNEFNTPIAPVNTPATVVDDPQFKARIKVLPHQRHGADMLAFPVHYIGEELPEPERAPTAGEHTEEVLRNVLGYDTTTINKLREEGVFGARTPSAAIFMHLLSGFLAFVAASTRAHQTHSNLLKSCPLLIFFRPLPLRCLDQNLSLSR